MKYLFIIILFTTLSSTAQQWDAEPYKKCAKIAIVTNHSPIVTLKKVAQAMLLNGYLIAKMDNDILTVHTEAKGSKMIVVKLSAYISTNDSNCIFITGQYETGMTFSSFGVGSTIPPITIEMRGQNNSMARQAWNELYNVSQSIPGKHWYLNTTKTTINNYSDQ